MANEAERIYQKREMIDKTGTNWTIQGGWLKSVKQVPSPNQDERPSGEISLLVIHCISLPPGEFGGTYVDRLFTNRLNFKGHPYFAEIAGLKVSSHLLIDRHGHTTQYVPFHRRAWHAGVSCFQERECCNDFSIGIELEGIETFPYTDAQYATLGRVIHTLLDTYPELSPNRIVGHSDIAPGRKIDPGPSFDWKRLSYLLRNRAEGGCQEP
ncbi:MAG: 1,6-anhydro-N-acetylmuramyl-L-alanine amidase AmpD [Methylothermaceae bacterium]|nr:1,6-anhydro-N-acetylmuramyl-L-alanine amidase AmpD [Methylothermaceae bacterium]